MSEPHDRDAASTSFTVPIGSRLLRSDVEKIVNAARALVEAHERRSPTSEFATLGEEGAMFELNFRLGAWRDSRGKP